MQIALSYPIMIFKILITTKQKNTMRLFSFCGKQENCILRCCRSKSETKKHKSEISFNGICWLNVCFPLTFPSVMSLIPFPLWIVYSLCGFLPFHTRWKTEGDIIRSWDRIENFWFLYLSGDTANDININCALWREGILLNTCFNSKKSGQDKNNWSKI
jgi:hypothetical protein